MGVECDASLIIGEELNMDIAILLRIKNIDQSFNPQNVVDLIHQWNLMISKI